MADSAPAAPGPFELDTAVSGGVEDGHGSFEAALAPRWRASRGPHGGYLAAIILRALAATVADAGRAPRSLTIHYLRSPADGPVQIETAVEREGSSLSTLSARLLQDGRVNALALAAFSKPWRGAPPHSDLPMPQVAPPDPVGPPSGEPAQGQAFEPPAFVRNTIMQPRIGGRMLGGPEQAMEFGAWVGLREERPLDTLALAFFCDALVPAPFMAITEPAGAPTIDLTIHFRSALPRTPDPDPHELCLARVRSGLIQDGFFEEDCVIWAADGTVLAQSRQLALLLTPRSEHIKIE